MRSEKMQKREGRGEKREGKEGKGKRKAFSRFLRRPPPPMPDAFSCKYPIIYLSLR